MRILISGICGFVGSTIALRLRETSSKTRIFGFDNFVRPGSERNRHVLRDAGIRVQHGDIRCGSDLDVLPAADWVIDAAANPSVLGGVAREQDSSRQVMEHNLSGTINLLEYCKEREAGFILLSTSRVYSIKELGRVKVLVENKAFRPDLRNSVIAGLSATGIAEDFSNEPPLSLYGCTKLASEYLALEYGQAFNFPVWINRCGVLAGAGQFSRVDQGIFSFWINSWLRDQPLKYIGFKGLGYQVRDCLHPHDLVPLLLKQMFGRSTRNNIINLGGGVANSMSLAKLSDWCAKRFGKRRVGVVSKPRSFDIPWMVLNCARAAAECNWKVTTPIEEILEEIARHAEKNPDWLKISTP